MRKKHGGLSFNSRLIVFRLIPRLDCVIGIKVGLVGLTLDDAW